MVSVDKQVHVSLYCIYHLINVVNNTAVIFICKDRMKQYHSHQNKQLLTKERDKVALPNLVEVIVVEQRS